MVLGVSLSELFVVLGVGAWAFGPKELPRLGRTLGRLTGRATGFLYKMRTQAFKFAEDTEISNLHQELQATMYQLNSIREELRGGLNIVNPGPVAHHAIQMQPRARRGVDHTCTQSQATISGIPAPQHFYLNSPTLPVEKHKLPASSSFAASTFQTNQEDFQTTHVSKKGSFNQADVTNERCHADKECMGKQSLYIEVSAVSAGLAPERSKSMPTGSEIVLDALMEELVAHQAAAFMQQRNQPTCVMRNSAEKDPMH